MRGVAIASSLIAVGIAFAAIFWDRFAERDYSADRARNVDGVFVVGDDLTLADVQAIRAAIDNAADDLDKRILRIGQTGRNAVEVMTGEVRGPVDGGGDIILLEKVRGAWRIIDDGIGRGWVSWRRPTQFDPWSRISARKAIQAAQCGFGATALPEDYATGRLG